MSESTGAARNPAQEAEGFFPVSPLMIRNWSRGRFALYLRQGTSYVLYTSKGDAFTDAHRRKLDDMGVLLVHVDGAERAAYASYLLENLPELLQDEAIPLEQRGEAWYQASVMALRRVFEERLPKGLARRRFTEICDMLRTGMDFFGRNGALKQVARLVGRGYKSYHHSLGCAVLTYFVCADSSKVAPERLHAVCLGALLHDLGKARVPQDILDRDPETLTPAEREKLRAHAAAGVALCAHLPLEPETVVCMLLHHERVDGSGYPAGVCGEALPFYVKALAVCDVYDNLTRPAPWRPARTPYEALRFMKMHKDSFDVDAMRRLISVLSGAEVSTQ
jgi:HD-GYP domain-containing protein (c-di-GMP phosphodiesterase class II)